MKKAIAAALLLLSSLAASATSTTISGTKTYYPISFLLQSGQFCFNGACSPITNGAFSGTFTEGTATVTITNTSGNQTYLTIPSVAISTTTYNWDNYVTSASASLTGLGSPTIPCATGGLYIQQDSIPPYQQWTCKSVGGQFSWIPQSPINTSPTGHYAGTGAPSFNCTAPCDYVQTNGAPIGASWWILVTTKGSISNNWVLQTGSIASGTPFVVTSGCGTTGAVTGGTMTGNFTAGQTSCIPIITPGFTAPNGFDCEAHDLTTVADTIRQSAYSTTTCTLTGTVVNADVIMVNITAF
jgi:hypothetical protein